MKLPTYFALFFVLAAFTPFVFAWTEPASAPPGANVPVPINQSSVDQDKSGPLTLGNIQLFGNALLYLGTPIGTRHLNWGNTFGDAGYGLRSNTGVMQFKNSGSVWVPIVPNSGGPTEVGQFGYSVVDKLDYCQIPSLTNLQCETFPDLITFPPPWGPVPTGWTIEQIPASGGSNYLMSKEVLGQSTTPWTVCSMNGYSTPYDHQTRGYVVRKGPVDGNKWFVYYYYPASLDVLSKFRMSLLVTCWR